MKIADGPGIPAKGLRLVEGIPDLSSKAEVVQLSLGGMIWAAVPVLASPIRNEITQEC